MHECRIAKNRVSRVLRAYMSGEMRDLFIYHKRHTQGTKQRNI